MTYRRNDGVRPNVYSLLSGTTGGSNLSVPITVAMRYGRSMHNFSFSYNRTSSTTLSDLAYTNDVTGNLGVEGVATDPIDWGVPNLSFGNSLTSVRGIPPSVRNDKSWQVGYSWVRTVGTKHNLRASVTYQQDLNNLRSDSNPLGSYTFSGFYTGGGLASNGGPLGFADFLLGLPQQASIQTSDNASGLSTPIGIRGRAFTSSFQDDYRIAAKWTLNYGIQYNVLPPYLEVNGDMRNLDAAPDFTAVAPVGPGQEGPLTGTQYPGGLIRTDWNNVAPRIGAAWRVNNRTVMRFGYGLTYNAGSYSTIARNLYMQPPFFQTGTLATSSLVEPAITLSDPFAQLENDSITNTYGIDPNYQLGIIHQWDIDYSRDLFKTWSVGATYIGTKGVDLDLLRAPNRGPDGTLIPDVQSFTWQSSDGASHMKGMMFRVQKRQSHGVAGTVTYTLSKSLDDTTATGGAATVAQDDQNLAAEWGPSNFDRRHQVQATGSVQLPWGKNRNWLPDGGWLAAIVGDWSLSANLTWQTGTPLTARCSACAASLASGVAGTLRADFTGASISDAPPGYFFNPSAFAIPVAGTFGDSTRNVITGPSSHLLNAQLTRDISFTSTKVLSLNVVASNLLNTVNFAGIDTNVNDLAQFGKALSVGSMRTIRVTARFRF